MGNPNKVSSKFIGIDPTNSMVDEEEREAVPEGYSATRLPGVVMPTEIWELIQSDRSGEQ